MTVRYLTPHSKWSIHSEYQDNLLMLSLSRGGPIIWLSDTDAAKVGVHDNDWVEAVNRNGVVVARAVVSHRMPEGTVYMHHAQDRLIDVPISETSGKRGGIHNSATRLLMKPTHLAGGYAQIVGRDQGYVILRLNSGEQRLVHGQCFATVGAVSNPDHMNTTIAKAGRQRWLGRRPHNRGVTMNPIDHPHGGGEGRTSGGRHPVTPWGKPTKGKKTRSNKRTDSFIVSSRHARKKK